MTFVLTALIDGTFHYLLGPRTAADVRKNGYGFTSHWEAAWEFNSLAKAKAKARIVANHMQWDADRIKIETL